MALSFFSPDEVYFVRRQLAALHPAMLEYVQSRELLEYLVRDKLYLFVAEHGPDELFLMARVDDVARAETAVLWSTRADVQRRFPGLTVVSGRALQRSPKLSRRLRGELRADTFYSSNPKGELWDLSCYAHGVARDPQYVNEVDIACCDAPLPELLAYLPYPLARGTTGRRERIFEGIRTCLNAPMAFSWVLFAKNTGKGLCWRVKTTSLEAGEGFFSDHEEALASASRFAATPCRGTPQVAFT